MNNWRTSAACKDVDPELMSGEWESLPYAKEICARCPVSGYCLREAMDTDPAWGVWGGLDRAERRRLAYIGEMSICSTHGTAYVTSCAQCRRDGGETTQPHSTASKVGGRQEQIGQWVREGYRDTEIARMIGDEIGDTVSPTTVSKFRQRWGLIREVRNDMVAVRAAYDGQAGFSELSSREKESLWEMWEESGRTRSEFAKVFRVSGDTVNTIVRRCNARHRATADAV